MEKKYFEKKTAITRLEIRKWLFASETYHNFFNKWTSCPYCCHAWLFDSMRFVWYDDIIWQQREKCNRLCNLHAIIRNWLHVMALNTFCACFLPFNTSMVCQIGACTWNVDILMVDQPRRSHLQLLCSFFSTNK